MIIGSLAIDRHQGAVHTHRDSYLLSTVTAVSVRRPLLPASIGASIVLAGFGSAFGDLLYPSEIIFIVASSTCAAVAGWNIGLLSLVSRDLRGSDLSGAIWGSHAALQRCRADITRAIADWRTS